MVFLLHFKIGYQIKFKVTQDFQNIPDTEHQPYDLFNNVYIKKKFKWLKKNELEDNLVNYSHP